MKKVLIVILSIVTVFCLGLDVWYFYILKNGEDKIISDTFIVGSQTVSRLDEVTGEEITEMKYFCEVNIFDDVYEIKFNNLLDENKQYFYSQGIQFLANENKIDFSATYSKILETESIKSLSKNDFNPFDGETGRYRYYNRLLTDIKYSNLNYKTYATDINSNTYDSTNPVTDNYFFKIDLDGEIYGMMFNLDAKYNQNSNLYLGSKTTNYMDAGTIILGGRKTDTFYEYRQSDILYFAEEVYNAVINSSLKEGAKDKVVYMEFPDIFDYYKFENGQYVEDKVKTDLASKITAKIKNYYGIKINFNEGKMSNSSQSIFGMVDGNANYSNGEITPSDYFTGKTLIKLTENDFDWESTETSGEYLFKLSNSFKEIYKNYNTSDLLLYIEIDEAYLNSCNIKFVGFETGTFENFKVYKTVMKTTTGELMEVEYA